MSPKTSKTIITIIAFAALIGIIFFAWNKTNKNKQNIIVNPQFTVEKHKLPPDFPNYLFDKNTFQIGGYSKGSNKTTSIFVANLSVENVFDFYEQALLQNNWNIISKSRNNDISSIFAANKENSVSVIISKTPNKKTSISVTITK